MKFLYTIGILLYGSLIHIGSLFNPKAKQWVNGRKGWRIKLSQFKRDDKPLYWFHCASLGEFEQGRPIMEALKQKEDCQLIVSFFSPSGYRIRKDYKQADAVFYLPLDTVSNAKTLVKVLKPTRVFFVKYEFWVHLISVLQYQSVPVYLVSGIFRRKQVFFKWYGRMFRKVLIIFNNIFVQDQASVDLLKSIGVKSILAGDTRYDRVMQNSEQAKQIDLVSSFCKGEKVFVVGSSWIEDDQILMPLINSPILKQKVIVAPHEVTENRIKEIEKRLIKTSIRFSNYTGIEPIDVLIIDNIGLLMHLYQYGSIAYVGGGFKTGLHNILEPASFGIPVIFGPHHSKFPEAKLFIDHGVGFQVETAKDLANLYASLSTINMKDKVVTFMNKRRGATYMILSSL
jgi:3-deoxy-D-manno-octulosonic-acid transferase